MAFGLDFNKSSSEQQSSSKSRSEDFGSDVWGAQNPYLQNVYAQAQGLGGQPNVGGQGYNQAMGNLQGAQQGFNQSNQNLQQFQGQGVDPAVDAYSQRIGQQFNEQFMPGLQGQAIQAGGLGGSRQQIGAALGADRGMQAIGDFAANAYSGQQQRGLQAAQGQGQNAMGMGGLANPNLQAGAYQQQQPWYNLNQFSGLLGQPTILDQGALSTSQSQSTGSSNAWNFDGGFGYS
jgi:hypothetical protein